MTVRASSSLKALSRRRRDISAARRAEILRIARLDRMAEATVVNALLDYSLNRIHARRTGKVLPAYINIEVP